ncbi:MAG: DNA cytosine methyltransferase [Vicinamibacterales bacterium]
MSAHESLTVAGLFAGIGGIELGLHQSGHRTSLLCEIEPGANRVLASHFPGIELHRDVRELESVFSVDLLTAGFPCQDLSQAGRTAGIGGRNSGLVGEVFRLLDSTRRKPRWLMLENVPFMLQLDRGQGMRYLVDELEARKFRWAYRVVDTQAFGLPQRRQRVILVASRTEDPRTVLLADDAEPVHQEFRTGLWCGFYWTEGLRGLGWAVDGVPTLKGGSTIGIPSPPAIWNSRDGSITTPDIRDAERLQGFPPDWTVPALAVDGVRKGHRWKLVGNAVSVPVAKWVGQRLAAPGEFDESRAGDAVRSGVAWPRAAFGQKGKPPVAVQCSMWPVRWVRPHLSEFIRFEPRLLSERASAGFLKRAMESSLRFEPTFIAAVEAHIDRMSAPLRSRIPA